MVSLFERSGDSQAVAPGSGPWPRIDHVAPLHGSRSAIEELGRLGLGDGGVEVDRSERPKHASHTLGRGGVDPPAQRGEQVALPVTSGQAELRRPFGCDRR